MTATAIMPPAAPPERAARPAHTILLIAQAFPPNPLVGSLRARKVAHALRSRGHRVIVLTERLRDETAELRPDPAGCEVRPLHLGPPYRLRLLKLLRRVGWRSGRIEAVVEASMDAAEPVSELAWRPTAPRRQSLRDRLQSFVLEMLHLPDDEQRFILPCVREARRIIRHERVDVVYSTAPSFSSHMAALWLRRRHDLRWVAEFRDPWTDTRHPSSPRSLVHRFHQRLERLCLSSADRVVLVTEAARARLAARTPEDEQMKLLVAYNGIESLAAPRAVDRGGPMRIVHAGSFYHARDPQPFLDALARFRSERALTSADVSVELVGLCRWYLGTSVEEMARQRGLDDVVRFVDWLPHDEARALLERADLLFLIARNQPLQVPNKLFDYLATRRPILAEADADGETARILQRLSGHHVVAGGDVVELTAALHRAYEQRGRLEMSPEDETVLTSLSSAQQMAGLVAALGL